MINYYQLEQRIQRAVLARRLVGLSLAIVQGAEVTYARGFGTTSVEDAGLPVTPDTLFCIGSISKTLTATLVMRLVEQGKLALDTPVVEYLPSFQFSDPALGARITLRHVLSHTTGLPAAGKDFGPRNPDALRRFVWDELPLYSFIAPPGKLHLYNNTVFVLAGHLAEAVTGRFYDELMQELVFDPLGMARTTFDRLVAMTYPLALAHQVDDGALRTKHRFTDNVSGNPAGFGIGSTLDLASFAIVHLNQGQFAGTQLLAPASVAEMQLPHVNRHTFDVESHYGLGWYTGTYKGVRQVRHGGMLESYNCFLTLFPDRGVGMVLQSNYDDGTELGELVEQIYDGLLGLRKGHVDPRPVEADRATWNQHVGTYLSVSNGLATIRIDGDELLLDQGNTSTVLVAMEGGLYLGGDTPVQFLVEGTGPTEYILIYGTPYQRLEQDPSFVPDPQLWERYVGTYVAWRVDPYPVHVQIQDGGLLIRWGSDEEIAAPLSNTRFVGAYGLIEFEDDETGTPVLIAGQAARHYRLP